MTMHNGSVFLSGAHACIFEGFAAASQLLKETNQKLTEHKHYDENQGECTVVVGIIGESCTGKSTLALKLRDVLNGEVYTGKDYLRLAKNESMAKKVFQNKMQEATIEAPVIYVIAEKEHLELLPDKAYRILITAELDVIQERFAERMHGNLPVPVAEMLKRRHGCFDSEKCDIHIRSGQEDLDEVCLLVRNAIRQEQK